MNATLLKLICIFLMVDMITLTIGENSQQQIPTNVPITSTASQQYQDNVAQYVSGVVPYSPPSGYQYTEPNYGPSPDQQSYDNNYLIPYPPRPTAATHDQDDYENVNLSTYQYVSSILPYGRIIYRILAKAGLIVFGGAVLLAFGGLLTTAICTFTPFCTIQFNGLGINRDSMRSLMTPDNLSLATTFIHDAIEKYNKINKRKIA